MGSFVPQKGKEIISKPWSYAWLTTFISGLGNMQTPARVVDLEVQFSDFIVFPVFKEMVRKSLEDWLTAMIEFETNIVEEEFSDQQELML